MSASRLVATVPAQRILFVDDPCDGYAETLTTQVARAVRALGHVTMRSPIVRPARGQLGCDAVVVISSLEHVRRDGLVAHFLDGIRDLQRRMSVSFAIAHARGLHNPLAELRAAIAGLPYRPDVAAWFDGQATPHGVVARWIERDALPVLEVASSTGVTGFARAIIRSALRAPTNLDRA